MDVTILTVYQLNTVTMGEISDSEMESFDMVIIGAGTFPLSHFLSPYLETNTPKGIAGLPFAKTQLQIHPSSSLLVLDSNNSVGGTWARERIYDGLLTNNLFGMLEYSDFPMDPKIYDMEYGNHVPGMVMHKYLTDYARHFGIFERTRFGCEVVGADLQSNGSWIISYKHGSQDVKITTAKLILATGTTSDPYLPNFEGKDNFAGQLFHSRELPFRSEDIAAAKNVVVIGGSKSAADSAFLCYTKGPHVDWVIRSMLCLSQFSFRA